MKSRELLKILTRDGWYPLRQSGSHIILKHDKKQGAIVFPFHPTSEIKKGLLFSILKKAGINIDKR
ncbi:MAG: type II toxin-antitoxin system HicA family toxin [Bacteroidales bacterium]